MTINDYIYITIIDYIYITINDYIIYITIIP